MIMDYYIEPSQAEYLRDMLQSMPDLVAGSWVENDLIEIRLTDKYNGMPITISKRTGLVMVY